MPLASGPGSFQGNVRTLMGEVGKSPHVQSRQQALAIAYAKERGRAEGGGMPPPPPRYEENVATGAGALPPAAYISTLERLLAGERTRRANPQPQQQSVQARAEGGPTYPPGYIEALARLLWMHQQRLNRGRPPTGGGIVTHDQDEHLPPLQDDAKMVPMAVWRGGTIGWR